MTRACSRPTATRPRSRSGWETTPRRGSRTCSGGRAGGRGPVRGDDHGRVHGGQRLSRALDLKEGELFFGLPRRWSSCCSCSGPSSPRSSRSCSRSSRSSLALALVAVIGQVWEVSFFIVNMLSGMGSRSGSTTRSSSSLREERARGVEKLDAIEATGRTASRAVLFSGSAFVIALSGDAARARHDPAQPRARRRPRRDHGRARRDDAAAGRARLAR